MGKLFRDAKWCKMFLVTTGVMFLVGGFIYGFLGMWLERMVEDAPQYVPLLGGLMGGWLLAGILGGFLLFARWIGARGMGFKVVCIVLFPFTLSVILMGGIVGLPVAAVRCVFVLRQAPDA